MSKFLEKKWNRMPPRRRLFLLAAATFASAVVAFMMLLRNAGVREVLYKAF